MLPKRIDLGDVTPDRGVSRAERYERFAGHFAATRNPGQAFRLAFVPDRSMALSVINDHAQRLLRDPEMTARVRTLIDMAAQGTVATIQSLLVDFHDIATADVNELVSHVIDSCRHCHGVDHAYQWIDEAEYMRECSRITRANARKAQGAALEEYPDASGGFGYWPTNEPHPCCPLCFGRGTAKVIIHDTTKASPAARKLFKGVNNKGEVQLHDQAAAREALLRAAGVFKEGVPLAPPSPDDPAKGSIPANVSEAEAGRAYLRLVGGTDISGG